MARWDDGYTTDLIYTSGFYRELAPSWLCLAALLMGHRPPDLSRPFRWAELGCGNGFSACALAATCPGGAFWAFDFNPAHVENARLLAAKAGVTNLTIEEVSFAELAAREDAALPQFDFIVAHGVYSWVSPLNRSAITDFVRRRLVPGGLAYVSYNVLTGWASMLPVRHLMRLWQEVRPGGGARDTAAILAFLRQLKEAGAALFAANPAIETRLGAMDDLDPRYLIHEYLNADWAPLMSDAVAADLETAKCTFIGSASLADNMDLVSVPTPMLDLLRETRDPRLKEVIRDVGSAQGFRRDIFRRGANPPSQAEHLDMLDAVTLVGLGRKVEGEIRFGVSIGEVSGKPEVYDPLLARLRQGPITLRALRESEVFADKPASEALQAVALLVSGGFAHPLLPVAPAEAARRQGQALNAEIARRTANGTPLPYLAAPAIGSAVSADPIEILALAELEGPDQVTNPSVLAERMFTLLQAQGRSVQKDGKAVSDPAEARAIVAGITDALFEARGDAFRDLAIRPTRAL
jgi:SAM-dependent methyltransferase